MSKCENSGCKMPCETMPPCAKSEARLRKWLRNIGNLASEMSGDTETSRQMPRGCRTCEGMRTIIVAVESAVRGEAPRRLSRDDVDRYYAPKVPR
jgi:hypothetical protein